jgi:DNA processing protein
MLTIAAGSSDYPPRLLELPDAPLQLHASGPLPRAERWVAIVGARSASEGGRTLAERMAKTLAERNIGVVSGGALGIDAAAHRGALAGRGPTIVVLPTPIHRPAPKRNWRLFGDVARSGGALISELSRGPIGKWSFMHRNRLIAALADALVIVEAAETSGTRHTARAAERLGRPIAVVPWDEGDPRGALAAELLPRGATPLRSVVELMAWLSIPLPPDAEPDADPILCELGEDAIAIDRLASKIRMPIHRLLAHLTRLELDGRIQVLPGSRVRRT